MRRSFFLRPAVAMLIAAALTAAAFAQGQKAPAVASPPPADQTSVSEPTKPYKQVALTPPATVSDPSFAAFRGKLGDAARRKDRAALARLTVNKGFFWDREGGNAADKRKAGIDNLAVAIGLDGKDAAGWDMLAGYAEDPTGSAAPDHPGATCAPADPGFDGKAMQAMLEATGSDIAEWGYPVSDGVEVRDRPEAKAPVTQKLGLYFIRVAPDATAEPTAGSYLRIVTPAGTYGYVALDDIAPLGNDQLCYIKDGGDWKIAGYIGVGSDIP
jgi:hypothetical protein